MMNKQIKLENPARLQELNPTEDLVKDWLCKMGRLSVILVQAAAFLRFPPPQ